jgi:hypothetical protein
MRMSPIIIIVAMVLVVGVFSPAAAQYYTPYPYYYAPYPPPAPPSTPRRAENPTYYKLVPSPELLWKWDQHNRWLDFQNEMRSRSYPESALEFMLRTF